MSAETKVKAVEKLNKINIKIGYPDKWKDYSKLDIKVLLRRKLFRKHEKSFSLEFPKDIDKLDKPVDKTEWYMSPQTVNAYYNPAYNDCISGSDFTSAFYNYQADEAVNYGGIGAVIGHEILMVLMTRVLVTMQMEI
jgi:endothelin-converting enzyme/putative endopeptidase